MIPALAASLSLLTLGSPVLNLLEPRAPPTPKPAADVGKALYHALGLEFGLGDSWLEVVPALGGMRCTPEDDPLYSAMDCFSPLALGPFGPDSGARSDGFTVYSYTERTVDRISATQTHREDCAKFQTAMAAVLAGDGVGTRIEPSAGGSTLRAGDAEAELTVVCRATSQSIELSPTWGRLVPRGECPGLSRLPERLRALEQRAMLGEASGSVAAGLDCNVAGADVLDFVARVVESAQLAHSAMGLKIPAAPPIWVVDQIRRGLASVQSQGAGLRDGAARHLALFLSREASDTYLDALWTRISQSGAQLPGPPARTTGPQLSRSRRRR
jgi:hypothetical protein